ncbi:MAG: ABC transporter ATP-binding protein, partial [Pseudomonadota bacterium]
DRGSLEKTLIEKYGNVIARSADAARGLLSNADMKKIDPRLLHQLKTGGLLSEEKYVLIRAGTRDLSLIGDLEPIPMADGSAAVPLESLYKSGVKGIQAVRGEDLKGVVLIGGIILLLIFVAFGLGYGEYLLLELTGQRIMLDIRNQLFGVMQDQSLSFFNRHPVGRLVTRVTNDVENLNEMFKSVVITVFKDIFILTGILAVLFYMDWRLALVCFTLVPVTFGVTLLFSHMAREVFREMRAKVSKINAFLQERVTGMRVIQLFAREAHQMEFFSRINHENYLAGMKQIRVFGVFMPLMELISSFALALLIWYGGGKVIEEELSLGSLVAFISYIRMFFRPIRDISEKYNIMQSAMASTERIFEFMDHREIIPEPDRPERPQTIEGRLDFENVSFAYERDRPVLLDVSFEVRPGEMVAIVGATGAGKSTIVNLIERFYDPDQGRVLLDGRDIRDLAKGDLRRNLGLVMQDVFIFSGHLLENITLGEKGRESEAVDRAIREANAKDFIERLPNGLFQELGEGGSTLSAGERQLLSFARALAFDPKILVLDEATSSVDPETERLIQEALFRIAARRTTIVVAHRLSTIRKANRILVMHKGRIREQGAHEELMALKGIYYKLNQLQMEADS